MNSELTTQQWTEVIEPKTSLFDLKLKEVWNYRDLLFMFVKRDFTATYKQTILGPLWFFIGFWCTAAHVCNTGYLSC